MSNISDLNQFKKAKIIVKDLEEVIKIIGTTMERMKSYTKYRYVTDCISIMDTSKMFLEIHLNDQKKILANKGTVYENVMEFPNKKNT